MEKANPFLSETVNSCERNAEKVPTLRFTLSLTESSDKSCPEFSFLDLIKSAPADKNKEKTPWEDEEGDEEKLRALAKKFEEKYAPKPRSRKRRLDRVEDLVDVTYGYDETDPFVDDTEAYDELIPADWTTEHGGFYINQGELSFRPASSDESEDDDFKEAKKIKHKSPKKTPKVPKVKKVKDPNEKKEKKKSGDKEKKPKKITSGEKEKDKEKKPKKKHSAGSANVLHQLLSPSSAAKNSTSSAAPSSNTTTPSLSTSSLHATNSTVGITSHPAKPPNSLQQSTQGTVKTEPASASVNCSSGAVGVESALGVQPDSIISSTSNSSLQNGVPSGEGISAEAPEPKLPQCLPPDVESCIMRLKQAANDSADEGKCKFFNSDVNHMLLELETKSRALSSKVRSGIYEFLAFYLPCTKETLLKRAKKLLLTDQAGRLREPMAKLKAAVDRVIPEQVKRFEEEVKRHVEEESQQSGPKLEGENADDHKKELFKSAMELSEDPEKTEEVTTPTDPNASALPEDKTKKSVPKRKFIWSDELRELLCDVVQMKLKLFEMSKTRVTSAEDYLKHFFENEVRPLWPKGWMTSRILFKESKQAHGKHTSVPARVYKKAVTVPKKQGDSGDNADSNMSTVDAKDVPVVPPLMTGIIGTLTNTVPAVAASTITSISVTSNNPPTTDKPAEMKPTAVTLAPVLTVNKPVATAASVTKMESTVINRPEQKSQAVSVIAGLNFAEKNTNQITTVKTPPSSESVKSQPLTILDFADIISSEVQTQKLLPSQQTLSPQQQMAALLKKTPPLPKDKPREQTLTHLPSSLAASVMSPIKQSLTMSSPQTLNTMPSPPKIVHSSPVAVHSNIQPGFTTASMVGTIGSAVHNSFIDLTSTIRPQQMPSVSAAPQTILGSISSPRRALDLKSCQVVHPSFPQGLTPQSIAMSLNSTMPTQALHQPQPPNLTLFGSAANLQGKGTTPLTHIGLVPPSLQSAMLHLSRQSQDQAGLVLPQNHFNQVLLGMNPSTNQSMPSLQLPHGALLSNQTVYQDPNQTPTSGAHHQSPFLPRFN